MNDELTTDLADLSDRAWSYALALTVFDLAPDALALLDGGADPLVMHVAEAYGDQRERGLWRRAATAENSIEWASKLRRAIDSSEAERDAGRLELFAVEPSEDCSVLTLDRVMLRAALELAMIVEQTNFGPLWIASVSGYYNDPSGSLDDLFARLDRFFGKGTDVLQIICYFNFGDRFTDMTPANKVQWFAGMRQIRERLDEEKNPPQLVIAARWGFEKLLELFRRLRAEPTAEIPAPLTALLSDEVSE